MPKLTSTVIAEQERLLGQGQFESVLLFINKYRRKKKLDPFEKVKFSSWLHWMGQSEKALKLLGPPLTLDELHSIEDPKFYILQIRIAHMLNFFGARKTAKKIYLELENFFELKQVDILKLYPQYYNSLGNYYLQSSQFHLATQTFKKFGNDSSALSSQYFFNLLGQCDGLNKHGKSAQAIELLQSISSDIKGHNNFQAIFHQAMADYYLHLGKYTEAQIKCNESSKFFSNEDQTAKDYAYLCLTQGLAYLATEDPLQASPYLQKAYHLLSKDKFHPGPLLETDLALQLCLEKLGKPARPWRTLIHPLMPPLTGEHWKKIAPPKWNKSVCLLASTNDHETDYSKAILNLPKQGTVWDLVSGLIFKNGEVEKLLNHLETKLLCALVATKNYGIYQYALYDLIYTENFPGHEVLVGRLKKLLNRYSKNIGFKKSWKNGVISLEKLPDRILFPKDGLPSGPQAYIQSCMEDPSVREVAEILKSSTSRAVAILKKVK